MATRSLDKAARTQTCRSMTRRWLPEAKCHARCLTTPVAALAQELPSPSLPQSPTSVCSDPDAAAWPQALPRGEKLRAQAPDAVAEALNLPLSCSRFYMVRMLIKCFDDGEAQSWTVTAWSWIKLSLEVLRTQGGQVLVLLTRTPKHKSFSICINSRRF
jgi:hypothetical protein